MNSTNNLDYYGACPYPGAMEMFQQENATDDDHSLHEASESTGVISSSHVKPFDQYKMNHGDRGYALIFNNREFQGANFKKRDGTDKDLKTMLSLLKVDFGFQKAQIKVDNDATTQEMKKYIKAFAEKDYTNCDCFVCVILSYGTKEGDIYGTDGGEPISMAELMEPLKGKSFQASKSLIGKPKIFIIQACVPEEESEKEHDAALDAEQNVEVQVQIPSEADFFTAWSSVPGSLTRKGSWFIQTFSEVVKAKGNSDDLLSLLTKTKNKIVEKYGDEVEVPLVKSMLTKKIFF